MVRTRVQRALAGVVAVLTAAMVSACTVAARDPHPVASPELSAEAGPGGRYGGPPLTTTTVPADSALEGGMAVYVGSGPEPARCTAGFPLVGVGGIRYYLIAGHCARGEQNAPVFVDLKKLDANNPEVKRVQIGTITENQYPADYRYQSGDPTPFPDIAIFTPNTKTWPAPAVSTVGGLSIAAVGYPTDKITTVQESNGEAPFCWPAWNSIGYTTECGNAEWVQGNYVGIRPTNPDWAASVVGDGYPGTPVWAADPASKRLGTVGIMSLKLDNGIYVVNVIHEFINNRYIEDSALGADMPDGFVPDPPIFAFPK